MTRNKQKSIMGGSGQHAISTSAAAIFHLRAISGLVIWSLFLAACQPIPTQGDPVHPWWSCLPVTPPPTSTATPFQSQTTSPTSQMAVSTATGLKSTPVPTQVRLTTVRPVDLKGAMVTLLHPWSGDVAVGLQEMVDEFNRKNEWGIQVNVTLAGSQSEVAAWMGDALSGPQPTSTTPGLSVAQKSLPDVVAAGPVDAQTWQAADPVLESIQDYAGDPTWGLTSKDLTDLQTSQWPGAAGGSAISAAPALRSLIFFYYNQTWAKSLGFFQPPSTPEEFRQQACKAAKANQYDPDPQRRGTGGWLVTADPISMLGWFQAFGGQIGPDSDGRYTFNTPAIKQAFTFLKGLENQNCAWIGRAATPYDYFVSREALFYLGALNDLPEQRDAMHKVSHPDQWTVFPYPVVEGKPLVVADDINFYLVKSSPARQMAAWLFIRWMESGEQQVRWMQLSNTIPLGQSVQAILGGFLSENPQWATAFDLLPLARPQPARASWALVSGVLGDGAQQILQPGTSLEDIPTILAQVDQTAAELMIRTAP